MPPKQPKLQCLSCHKWFSQSGLTRHHQSNAFCSTYHPFYQQELADVEAPEEKPAELPPCPPTPEFEAKEGSHNSNIISTHIQFTKEASRTPPPLTPSLTSSRSSRRVAKKPTAPHLMCKEPSLPQEKDPQFDFNPALTDFVGELLASHDQCTDVPIKDPPTCSEATVAAQANVDPHHPTTLPDFPTKAGSRTINLKIGVSSCEEDIQYTIGEPFEFPIQTQMALYSDRFFGVDKVLAKFHHTCYQAGAPRYLADELIKVLQNGATQYGFTLSDPRITQRPSLLKRLQQTIPAPPPKAIKVNLESGFSTTVFAFDFQDQLQRHLLSPAFANYDNLQFSAPDTAEDSPFDCHAVHKECSYSDICSAQWYQDALQMYHEDLTTGTFMLHPFIAYMDKTGVDKVDRTSLEPIAITSALLTQEARENVDNWIHLGFVPNQKWICDRNPGVSRGKHRSISQRDYHHCLSKLLQPLKDLQKQRPVMLFRRGSTTCALRIIAPLAAMVGDNLSNDTLAQRVGDKTESTPRLSRRCLCAFQDADNAIHKCHELSWEMVHKLSVGALGVTYGKDNPSQNVIEESTNYEHWRMYVDMKAGNNHQLRSTILKIKQHRMSICDVILHKVLGCQSLQNAFHGIDFGPTDNGILRATTSDLMHTIEEGLIPNILQVIFELMPDSQLKQIDQYVHSLFQSSRNRSREKDQYPRINFQNGFTKLTNLCAHERVGQLFMLSIILQTEKGRNLLAPRFDPDFDNQRAQRIAKMRASNVREHKPGKKCAPNHAIGTDRQPNEPQNASRGIDHRPPPLGQEDNSIPELEWNDIKEYLSSIQLGYIHESIYPSLPTHHQMLLRNVLKKTVKPTWKKSIDAIQLQCPPQFQTLPDLDYLPTEYPINPPRRGGTKTPHHPLVMNCSKQELEKAWTPSVYRSSSDDPPITLALTMPELTYLVEAILLLHSCVKKPQYVFDPNDKYLQPGEHERNLQRFPFALSLLLRVLTHGIHRGQGTKGWKLQKILELSHLLPDVIQFGSAAGFNTNTGERNLKTWAKLPSRTAQKNNDIDHLMQTSMRIHEGFLLSVASQDVPTQHSHGSNQNTSVSGEKYLMCSKTGKFTKVIGTRHQEVVKAPISPSAIHWFLEHFEDKEERLIPIYTEFSVRDEVCRAHADYRNNGPWYDYVLFHPFDGEESEPPFRIGAIWFDRNNGSATGTMRVLVQPADRMNKDHKTPSKGSMIFGHWKMRHRTRVVNEDRFEGTATFLSYPLTNVSKRTFCLDMSANLDGDPFCRVWKQTDVNAQGAFTVLSADRYGWPEGFLHSPQFLKRVAKQLKGSKRGRSGSLQNPLARKRTKN